MRVSVLGCGRWGSFIAWYLDKIGQEVCLWGRPSSAKLKRLIDERRNDNLVLSDSLELSSNLKYAVERAEVIVVSIGAQAFRDLLGEVVKNDVGGRRFVLCMKGIEISTGKRLSEVAAEFLPQSCKTAVWVGPGHPQDFVKGIPNCMVVDAAEHDTKKFIIESFRSDLIRFYYGNDLIGNEIGAATKNVIGIAAGMLDGLNYRSLKGALMSRGAREISRLIGAMGGNPITAYGLAHLGDYEATVFSPYSRNREFGEKFVQGEIMSGLAEGVYTAKAMANFSELYGVELPICSAVNATVNEGRDVREVINELFLRSIKSEFDA